MKKFRKYLSEHRRSLGLSLLVAVGLGWLLFYRLGSLVGGLSGEEVVVAHTAYGWHGLYHQPLNLPLNGLRSAIFWSFRHHGQLLTRLPNALIGLLTVVTFAGLLRSWHGTRTTLFATLLFACGAWTLHVSRLASNDVLYLWALPTLLLVHLTLQKRPDQALSYYGSMLLWGLLLYIPGLVWLVLLEVLWQRGAIAEGWQYFSAWWQRLLYVVAGLLWIPLLGIDLARPGQLRYWLGLPARWPTSLHYLKQLAGVPVHLFIRGPAYPDIWLGRAPILGVFSLVMCGLGIYFYATHWKAARSRLLASFFIVGVLLVSLGGAVSLSLLVPLLYIAVAAGIAYLLHEWLQVFPFNPLARSLGLGLVILAVALSCVYSLRSYFIAWPHNSTTVSIFRYHR